jgi:glycosyltransferase involved in cell wall biosynthesis
LGHTYDIIAIVEAARLLEQQTPSFQHSQELAFRIIGDGPLLEAAQELAKGYELKGITFLGRLPFDRVVAELKASAIGLNSYAAGAPQSFTNKICEYFGAGLPVVNSIPGELAELIDTNGFGRNYQAGSPESLAKAILELLNSEKLPDISAKVLNFAETTFDRAKIYPALAQFLEGLVSGE